MTIPQLPPELTDRVIQFVDRDTVPACALVCSSWLPASRYRLFRSMRIRSAVSYELVVSRVLPSESMKHYLLDVRKLVLWNRNKSVWPHERKPEKWPSFFQLFAAHLPKMTILVLGDTIWDQYPPHPSTSLVISRLISLRVLELRRCKFPSFGTLRRAIAALPSLTTLTVEVCSWPEPSVMLLPSFANGSYGSNRPTLSTLYLYFRHNQPARLSTHQLMSWLSSTATPSTLRDLHFMVFSPHDGYRGFLDFFGPSFPLFMRHISYLGISMMKSVEDHPHLFSNAVNLREISMGLDPDSAEVWKTVAAMFQSLPCSARIEKISISGHISGLPSQDILPSLESIDSCLEGDAFAGLRRIRFSLRYTADTRIDTATIGEDVLKVLQGKLPKLFGRRDVKIRFNLMEHVTHWVSIFDYSSQESG